MPKFGSAYGKTSRQGAGPIKTTGAVARNHGGALAYARDAKSDLFMLGVMNFVSEDTFYESADSRDARFVDLVRTVTTEDPTWMEQFIPWLRNSANMRSASVVAAVEYALTAADMQPVRDSDNKIVWMSKAAEVIDSACSRADEPGEVLAYWIGVHGGGNKRGMPSSVKRGAARAAQRLYNQKSLLKYDGNSKAVRFADVIQIAHPKPKDPTQEALFKVALDSRYKNQTALELLPTITAASRVNSGQVSREELLASPELYRSAGMTWEQLSGLGPMDAPAWELAIPTMGYMATLRNLRNFEQAGISTSATNAVIARLTDPEQVAKSRQLPFRFWSAYRNVHGLQWGWALEQALGHSLQNLPSLGGRTLILIDTSASMERKLSENGTVAPLEVAGVFASALALKGEAVDFYGFANSPDKIDIAKGGSVLKAVEHLKSRVGVVGHGTNIPDALRTWDGHDRVVIISDMQTLSGFEDRSGRYNAYQTGVPVDARAVGIPERVPVFGFNLCGYATTQIGGKNQFELGGLTDHTFKMLDLLEKGSRQSWPWEA